MITLTMAFTFMGFFLAYNTSKRAKPVNGAIHQWAQKHPKNANILGASLLLAGLVPTVFGLGWGAGILSYLVVLMLLGSLTVLVSPLHFFSLKKTVLIALILFLIELNLT